ncbi:Kelch repeat-containing protein [Leptospira paudalimensis]|uniref:Uncharacterized protein n=1 Tax=Leptospira paudalimensis TaxID=2950024 RepID=A0ABT3M8H2_9LEPT|nr:hypothetical protein [Leptospira paudalimensis]MCW7504686.1 hypothetical protein [Leptospira paudalimensis]
MHFYSRFTFFFVIFCLAIGCKVSELNNACDPSSKSFLTFLLIKNVANDRSPSCVPYIDRNEPNFVSYGVFTTGSPAEVVTATISKGKIYIGGLFDQIAATTGGGAFIWSDSSIPIASTYCPQLDVFDEVGSTYGTINHAVLDQEGNLYILGKFTHIQGIPRNNIAKINQKCQLDLRFDARLNTSSSIFYDLIYLDGRIFFSGDFQTSNGPITNFPSPTNREHIASINATTGVIDSWAPNVSGTDVKSLVTDGTYIYIGGSFTAVNGNGAGNLGKLHKDNGNTFYPIVDTNGSVNTLLLKDGTLYVGGVFSSLNAGTVTRSKLAAIDLTTNTVTSSFSSLLISGNAVFDLAIYKDQLFVAGEISTPRLGIFKVDLSGNLQPSNYNLDGVYANVYKLSIVDDKLYAFGFFESVRNLERKYFFQLNIETDEVTSFDPRLFNLNFEFQGVALKLKENVLFLGGGYGAIDTRTRNYFAELDLATGTPTDWDPNPNDIVTQMLAVDNKLYLHGQFTSIVNTTRQSTAAFQLDTKTLLTWNPIFPASSIETMIFHKDSIYASGNFTTLNSIPVNRIVKLDSIESGFDANFLPNPNNTVRSLLIWEEELLASGQFTTFSNPAVHLAKINRFNGTFIKTHTDSFTSNFSAYSIFVSDNRLIMSGQYQTTSPYPGNSLSYYQLPDLTSIQTNGTLATASEFVRSIDQNENKIYLGGLISTVSGAQRVGIFSQNRSDLTLNSWDPKFQVGSTVRKVISNGNSIYVFGNITNPNKRYRAGLVKLDKDSAFLY